MQVEAIPKQHTTTSEQAAQNYRRLREAGYKPKEANSLKDSEHVDRLILSRKSIIEARNNV